MDFDETLFVIIATLPLTTLLLWTLYEIFFKFTL